MIACSMCRKLQTEAQAVSNQQTALRQQAGVDPGISPSSSFAGHMRSGRPPPVPQHRGTGRPGAPFALLPPDNGKQQSQMQQMQMPTRQQQRLLGPAHAGRGADLPQAGQAAAGVLRDVSLSPSDLNMTDLSGGGASDLLGSALGQERGKQSMRAAANGASAAHAQHKSGVSDCSRGSRGSRGSLADLLKAKYTQR